MMTFLILPQKVLNHNKSNIKCPALNPAISAIFSHDAPLTSPPGHLLLDCCPWSPQTSPKPSRYPFVFPHGESRYIW